MSQQVILTQKWVYKMCHIRPDLFTVVEPLSSFEFLINFTLNTYISLFMNFIHQLTQLSLH